MLVILWPTDEFNLPKEIQITDINQQIDQFVPNFVWLPHDQIDLTGRATRFYGSVQPRY